ncbi:MAG: diguanylate cyclase [Gammaproteobacteria bacterium]
MNKKRPIDRNDSKQKTCQTRPSLEQAPGSEDSGARTDRFQTTGDSSTTVIADDLVGTRSGRLKDTKPYLVILSGRDQGKCFELSKQINQFGRNQNADIVILDPKMSRNHGRLIVYPDWILIEDNHSTNGTFVDDVRIDKQSIDAQSRIRIGSTIMKIDYKDANEARAEGALYEAAHTDPLTGIANRRAFMTHAGEEIALCRQNNLGLAIVMCDADHFKKINDTYGHPAGDFVLQEFANLIKQTLRFEDQVARYGGEEFIILLRDLDIAITRGICERIRIAIESNAFVFQGQTIPCTLSMGVCCRHGAQIPSLEQFIQIADAALLTAKSKGRNRIEIG